MKFRKKPFVVVVVCVIQELLASGTNDQQQNGTSSLPDIAMSTIMSNTTPSGRGSRGPIGIRADCRNTTLAVVQDNTQLEIPVCLTFARNMRCEGAVPPPTKCRVYSNEVNLST